jgi:hypothetical protein
MMWRLHDIEQFSTFEQYSLNVPQYVAWTMDSAAFFATFECWQKDPGTIFDLSQHIRKFATPYKYVVT